jgi:hypothetical protein
VQTENDIFQLLNIDEDAMPRSTPEQRRALYRMGRSKSWVRKYASTRQQASELIQNAISEMTKIKSKSK